METSPKRNVWLSTYINNYIIDCLIWNGRCTAVDLSIFTCNLGQIYKRIETFDQMARSNGSVAHQDPNSKKNLILNSFDSSKFLCDEFEINRILNSGDVVPKRELEIVPKGAVFLGKSTNSRALDAMLVQLQRLMKPANIVFINSKLSNGDYARYIKCNNLILLEIYLFCGQWYGRFIRCKDQSIFNEPFSNIADIDFHDVHSKWVHTQRILIDPNWHQYVKVSLKDLKTNEVTEYSLRLALVNQLLIAKGFNKELKSKHYELLKLNQELRHYLLKNWCDYEVY